MSEAGRTLAKPDRASNGSALARPYSCAPRSVSARRIRNDAGQLGSDRPDGFEGFDGLARRGHSDGI